MGAAAAPIIGAGISAGAGLMGSGKAAHAQQAQSDAAAGLYNQEKQAIQQLLGNYFSVAPGLEDQLLHFGDHAEQQQMGLIQKLANTMGSSDQSLIQGIRSQIGGVANPGAMIGSLVRSNAQNEGQAVQGMQADMQSMLSGEELQALSTLGSFISAPLASSLGGLQSMGNTYANAAASGGNPWESAISGIGNFIGMLGPKSSSSQPSGGGLNMTGAYPTIPTNVGISGTLPGATPGAAALGWGQSGVNTDPYSTVGSRFASGAVGPG